MAIDLLCCSASDITALPSSCTDVIPANVKLLKCMSITFNSSLVYFAPTMVITISIIYLTYTGTVHKHIRQRK